MVLQFEGVGKFLKDQGWDQKDVWLGETASGSISSSVVSIKFSPLCTIELTNNWYQLHNGDYD